MEQIGLEAIFETTAFQTGLGIYLAGVAAAGAAVVGFGAFLADNTKKAMEAEKVQAELNAVLKSTKGAAGISADEINNMANALSKVTLFEDEAIMKGQSMLLTFTQIGKDVFPMATEAMLNMAQKFGGMEAASVQLGKALNDPINGVTALRRVGVMLTDEQEKQIKMFMRQGKVADAQKVILGELETEFGGLARAMGETASGKLDILKNQFENLQETIGNAILPSLTELASKFIDLAQSPQVMTFISNFANGITRMRIAFEQSNFKQMIDMIISSGEPFKVLSFYAGVLADDLASLFPPVLQPTIQAILDKLILLADPLLQFLDAVQNGQEPLSAASEALSSFKDNLWTMIPEWLKPSLDELLSSIQNLGVAAQTSAPMVQEKLGALFTWIGEQAKILAPQILENLGGIFQTLADIWTKHGATIMNVLTLIFQLVTTTIGGAITLILGLVESWLQWMSGLFDAFSLAFQGKWQEAALAILLAVQTSFTTLLENVQTFFDSALSIAGTNLEDFKLTWSNNFAMLKTIVSTEIENIKTVLTAKIKEFVSIGRAVIQGLYDGMKARFVELLEAIAEWAAAMVDKVKETLGIQSPSKVFMQMGVNMMVGMEKGIQAGSPLAEAALMSSPAGAITNQTFNRSVTNNRNSYGPTITMNNNISNGMDLAALQAFILQTVGENA